MRFLTGLLLFGICLSGCQKYNKKPSDLLSKDTYINLFIELQLLKSYQIEQSPDSMTVDSLQKVIFKKYGATKKQFEKSHTYYQHNVKTQNKRIQEAIDRLNEDRIDKPDSLVQRDSTASGQL